MHQLDEVREALDREFPFDPGRSGDWDDVLVRAKPTRPERRRRRSPLLVLPAAVAAMAVAVLLWPGGDSSPSILERARAVASVGPVVHLVLAKEDGRMTELDLETGELRRLQGQHEQWFDPERGFHDLYTVDGRVNRDVLHPAGSFPEVEGQFLGLGSAYRKALESGRASVAGEGTVNGRDVYWIRFHVRYPSFGIPTYDAEHEVAIDAETFEPRLWRATEENEALLMPKTTTEVEIEAWETLPAGSGDFTAATDANALTDTDPPAFANLGPRTPEQARSVLSPPPLWLGDAFRGLALAAIYEVRMEEKGAAGLEEKPGLEVCYGARLNNTSCASPRSGEDHVGLMQTNTPIAWLGWEQVVEPAEGTMIVLEPGPDVGGPPIPAQGFARMNGVYVGITASDEGLLLAAGRALKPIRGS